MDIGVALPTEEYAEGIGPLPSYEEIRNLALLAENLGFDSIWCADHLIYRPSDSTPWLTQTMGVWECWTVLSALAEATTRIRLGSWVLCTPLRNPALLAKMTATLDEVSEGRFILGLGSGWNRPSFDAFGYSFDHLVSRFEEALRIIVPLLREGHVDFEGKYYRAPDCEIVPRGPSAGGVPILIAAQRPRMLRLAAQYADLWNRPSGYRTLPTSRAELLAGLDEACIEVGRDVDTIQITARMNAGFPDVGPIPPLVAQGTWFNGVDEVAEALRVYRSLGVSLMICEVFPARAASFEHLAEAVSAARGT